MDIYGSHWRLPAYYGYLLALIITYPANINRRLVWLRDLEMDYVNQNEALTRPLGAMMYSS